MADVAAEAGVAPATVYRHFSGRSDLLDAVLASTALRVSGSLEQLVLEAASLGEILTEGLVQIVDLLENDPLVSAMFSGDDRLVAGATVTGSAQIRQIAAGAADDVITARPDLATELRVGLPIEHAVDHLIAVGLSLVLTESPLTADPAAQRRYVQTFVLPALLETRPPLPEQS